MNAKAASQKQDLSTRVMSGWLGAIWFLLLGLVVLPHLWWVRNAALVWWVCGRAAYFDQGVRVLPGKPTRFSTGELAPQWPDMATGFLFFIVVAIGLTLLLVLGLRSYERYRRKHRTRP